MSLIATALTTLNDTKLICKVSLTDTSKDLLLEMYINMASQFVINYCKRIFKRTQYIQEIYFPSWTQWLLLRNYPVVDANNIIVEIGLPGQSPTQLTLNKDYFCYLSDQLCARLYKPTIWMTGYYVRNDLSLDPYSGLRQILVTYTSGYYMPGDVNYVMGDAQSIPLDISLVTSQITADNFYRTQRQNFDGLRNLTEGDMSWGFGGNSMTNQNANVINISVDPRYLTTLNQYQRKVIA